MVNRWDKVDTPQDGVDYIVNSHNAEYFRDYGGELGIGTDLPNKNAWNAPAEYSKFYRYNENYILSPNGSTFYGYPIYNPDLDEVNNWAALQDQANQISGPDEDTIHVLQARLFRHSAISERVFDELYDPKLIPLHGFAFPGGEGAQTPTTAQLTEVRKQRLARRAYKSEIMNPQKGVENYVAVTAYDRGIPSNKLNFLETGRDADANMKVFFPGSLAKENMNDIMVIPNPYVGRSSFDGRRENDKKGDKSRRLWFINLPERCMIRIYTLAGDLVQELDHEGAQTTDIITVSKASTTGISATGMHSWDLLSKHNQIIAPGVYLYSVENKAGNKLKVGKFVIIK
jgi:hypothetical protein